jgi:hypothetical protein
MIWWIIPSLAMFFIITNMNNPKLDANSRIFLKTCFGIGVMGLLATIFMSMLFILLFVKQGNIGLLEYFDAAFWSIAITGVVCGMPFAIVKIYKAWHAYEEKKNANQKD